MFGSTLLLGGILFTGTIISASPTHVVQKRAVANCPNEFTYAPAAPFKCDFKSSVAAGATKPISTTTTDFNSCVIACKANKKCATFGFTNSTTSCAIYSGTVTPAKTKRLPAVFYNSGCFVPVTFNPTPLINGGFETGDTTGFTITTAGDASVSINNVGENSGFSLDVVVTQGNTTDQTTVQVQQNFDVCPNVVYTFKASFFQLARATHDDPFNTANTPDLSIFVQELSTGKTFSLLDNASEQDTLVSNQGTNYKEGKWHDFSLQFTPPTGDTWAVIAFLADTINSTTNLRFDNFIIQAMV